MKKSIVCVAIALMYVGLWAMQPAQQAPQERMVILESVRKKQFQVPERVAFQSEIIKNALTAGFKETGTGTFYLPVNAKALALLIELMKKGADQASVDEIAAYVQQNVADTDSMFALLGIIDYLKLDVQAIHKAVARSFSYQLMSMYSNPEQCNMLLQRIKNVPIAQTYKEQLIAAITDHIKSKISDTIYEGWVLERILQSGELLIKPGVYSPDNRHVAIGTSDSKVQIWNVQTGVRERILEGHEDTATSLAYSPDDNGAYIATGSEDGTLRLWNTTTGQQKHILEDDEGDDLVFSVAYSPDGNHIAAGLLDEAVIWNAHTGQRERSLEGHKLWIHAIDYSPDGSHIVTGSADAIAIIWNAQTGAQEHVLQGHTDGINCASYSPDGAYIVTGSFDNIILLWNAQTGQQVPITFQGPILDLTSLVYHPDGRYIVGGLFDNTVKIWDVSTGNVVHVLRGHTGTVWSVACSRDGNHILSCSADGTARIWKKVSIQKIADLDQALLLFILAQKRMHNPNYGLQQLVADYQWSFQDEDGIRRVNPWARRVFNILPQALQQFIRENMPGQ